MKRKCLAVGIILLFFCICLSGCEGFHSLDFLKSDIDKFYGLWETEYIAPRHLFPQYYVNYSVTYEFRGNGIVRNGYGLNGTWELKDGKLIIIYDDLFYKRETPRINDTYTYKYSFSFPECYVLTLLKVPSDTQTPVVYKKSGHS